MQTDDPADELNWADYIDNLQTSKAAAWSRTYRRRKKPLVEQQTRTRVDPERDSLEEANPNLPRGDLHKSNVD